MTDDSPTRRPLARSRPRRWARPSATRRRAAVKEVLAGLAGAIGSVPDGMATALLAGANPVAGLYSSAMGPLFGGMVTSTGIMVIATTSAAALGTAEALDDIPADEIDSLLGTLVFLVGVFALLAGVLKLGRYTRFVSHSVMTGFLTGVSLILILSQFGDFVGYPATGANSVAKAWDTLTHIPEWSMPALAIGASAMVIAIVLDRTPLSTIGPLLAIVVPSVVVAMRPQAEVALASDTAEIPAGHADAGPAFVRLLTSTDDAVQRAGDHRRDPGAVLGGGRAVPQPRRRPVEHLPGLRGPRCGEPGDQPVPRDPRRRVGGPDRLQRPRRGGRPVVGDRLRGVDDHLPRGPLGTRRGRSPCRPWPRCSSSPGFQSLKPREVRAVWRTTRSGAVLMSLTLVATLLLPVTVAVGLGVILSALHTLNRSMNEVRVYALVEIEGRGTALRPAPEVLPGGEVTVLDIEGNLFYAGARSLEGTLPRVAPGSRPVVVLRLRGRDRIGATLVKVLEWYSGQIRDAGGRLYLSGVDPRVAEQIQRNGLIGARGPDRRRGNRDPRRVHPHGDHRRRHLAARGHLPGRVGRRRGAWSAPGRERPAGTDSAGRALVCPERREPVLQPSGRRSTCDSSPSDLVGVQRRDQVRRRHGPARPGCPACAGTRRGP